MGYDNAFIENEKGKEEFIEEMCKKYPYWTKEEITKRINQWIGY